MVVVLVVVAEFYNLVVWPRLLTKVSPSQHGDGGTCDYIQGAWQGYVC